MPAPSGLGGQAERAQLAAAFRHFASLRSGVYAPLYAHLAAAIADDADLLALAAHTRPGVSQPDLFLACVHYLLAQQQDHPLAAHYPTLNSADRPSDDPVLLFRDFCADHRAELAQALATRMVQTNEVRRCTFLRPAIAIASEAGGRAPLAFTFLVADNE